MSKDVVDVIEVQRDELRDVVRTAIGFDEGPGVSLIEGIRASGMGWYALLALGLLIIVDQFQTFGFTVLGPEIANALGLNKSALAALLAVKTVALTLAALPIAAFVQRKSRRGSVAVLTGLGWGLMTLCTGFVVSAWGLLLVLVLDGATSGSVVAVHEPLLIDTYPPDVRVRALSFYRAAAQAGSVVAPLIVGALTALGGYTWRGVFLVMGLASVAAAVVAARLRDPGFGRWDTAKIRETVKGGTDDGGTPDLDEDEISLGFFEIVRRLFLIPTVRRVLVAYAVLGMLLVPLTTYVIFFLSSTWGMGPGARGVFQAGMAVASIASLAVFGRRAEAMFRRSPASVVRLAGGLLAGGVTMLALGIVSPVFVLMVACFAVALGMIASIQPALAITLFSIVPARMRPHAAALIGIFTAAVGGFSGLVLLSGIDSRFGTAGAIVSLAIPGIAGGLILRSAAGTVAADLDRMIDAIVEEEEVAGLVRAGTKLPMLSCRHIDFSYGQLQVLFDVNFTVDDGEMVALLGTNGAGKSTLLRVISGLGLPTGGSVRFRGGDVTFLDAERRLALGITQIPGGRAIFGPMTVIENLRVLGFSFGRNKRAIDAGIEASFNAFPRLAERRNQQASTLSGGEQQMLGLATALITKPRLLLIDELSLGLAPRVVGELLDTVRVINESGTAVVLVEQSVNIALSLVQHAYFMEKGQVRFDGKSAELLARPDLLRSVFLEGASKGLSTNGSNGTNGKLTTKAVHR